MITGVYLADGTEVTTSTTTSGLWSGGLQAPIDQDLNGSAQQNQYTWTGSNENGDAVNPLGSSMFSSVDNTQHTNESWVFSTTADPTTFQNGLYGISQVLYVPQTAVPEPSSLLVASTALMAGMAFGWSRSRGAQRRQGPGVRPNATERVKPPIRALILTPILLGLTFSDASADLSVSLSDVALLPGGTGTMEIFVTSTTPILSGASAWSCRSSRWGIPPLCSSSRRLNSTHRSRSRASAEATFSRTRVPPKTSGATGGLRRRPRTRWIRSPEEELANRLPSNVVI